MPAAGRPATAGGCAPAGSTGPTTRCGSRRSGARPSRPSHLSAVVDLRQQSQFDRGPGFADRAITHHIPLVDRVINTDDPPRIEEPHHIAGLYDDMADRGR